MVTKEGRWGKDKLVVWDCCCWVTSVVSDSVRPHRRKPTRLPRPWDSPGKNIGVGCRFLLQSLGLVDINCCCSVTKSCPTLCNPMNYHMLGFPVGHYLLEFDQNSLSQCRYPTISPATASLMTQLVKNLPAMQETWVWFLGWEDPLEKGIATHSSSLAQRIPWTEETGGLQFLGSQKSRTQLKRLSSSMYNWITWLYTRS